MDYSTYNGRQVIRTGVDVTLENVVRVLESAMSVHAYNKGQIDFLHKYYLGNQPIYSRVKFIRPNINSRIAENMAYMAVRVITGYTFGKPVQYVQRRGEKAEQIGELNAIMEDEAKALVDMTVAKHQSICGTAYKLIVADPYGGDEHPIMIRALDPSNTFVVYSAGAEEEPVMGVSYYDVPDAQNSLSVRHFDIYTKNQYYHLSGEPGQYQRLSMDIVKPHSLGDIPIIEFPNGTFRLGDFEPALPIMDAINELDSDRINSVAQFVQAYMKFVNCQLDEEAFNEAKRLGAFMVRSEEGLPADIDFITAALDQNDSETLASRLDDKASDIIGIPQRTARPGGASDTGAAVTLRDGWADLETVAVDKENSFRPQERRMLRIALNILHTYNILSDLGISDVEVKFIRNRSDNLLVKSQSYMNLRSAQMNDLDALQAVSLFTDHAEVAARNKADKEEAMERAMALTQPSEEPEASQSIEAPASA
jgi:SPP1 family phage portal protein